jgi:hypothetical protein
MMAIAKLVFFPIVTLQEKNIALLSQILSSKVAS